MKTKEELEIMLREKGKIYSKLQPVELRGDPNVFAWVELAIEIRLLKEILNDSRN